MKLLLFTLAFFGGFAFVASAQKAPNEAVIWGGFEHDWTYNHRINRLGSYVQYNGGQPIGTHCSASGLGADSTFFASHYAWVRSPNLRFQEGLGELILHGKEKNLLSKEVQISVAALEGMENAENYTLLLNGFDIQATDGADKLQFLRIEAANVEYASATNKFLVTLRVAMSVNCETIECAIFSQRAKYKFKLFFLIIANPDEDLFASSASFSRAEEWSKKSEIAHEPQRLHIQGKRDPNYTAAMLGIRSFAVSLDQAHWTANLHNSFQPVQYTPANGKMDFLLDLYFKEWILGMKRTSAYPPHSKFSKRTKGWANQDITLVLLQFLQADIRYNSHKGSMFWRARNAPPDAKEAVHEQPLVFPK